MDLRFYGDASSMVYNVGMTGTERLWQYHQVSTQLVMGVRIILLMLHK